MMGLKIEFGWDQLPGNGEPCSYCQEPITGQLFKPYYFIGDPKDVTYFPQQYCEKCYLEEDKAAKDFSAE